MALLDGFGIQPSEDVGISDYSTRQWPGAEVPVGSNIPPIVDYYKMIGIASGNLVSWIVTGSPDPTGTSYAGPGVLDLATISVSDFWQV
jgi:hypothetical protein